MSLERVCKCGREESVRFNFADPVAEREFHAEEYVCPDCRDNEGKSDIVIEMENHTKVLKNLFDNHPNQAQFIKSIGSIIVNDGVDRATDLTFDKIVNSKVTYKDLYEKLDFYKEIEIAGDKMLFLTNEQFRFGVKMIVTCVEELLKEFESRQEGSF